MISDDIIHVTTDDAPVHGRTAYWQQKTAELLVSMDYADVADDELIASQRVVQRGPLRAVHLTCSPHVVERGWRLVKRYQKPSIFMCILINGEGFVYQGSKCAQMAPGDIVIYDVSRPYIHGFTTTAEHVTYDLPASEFYTRFGAWNEPAVVHLSAQFGTGAVASRHLANNARKLFKLAPHLPAETNSTQIWQAADNVMTALRPYSPAEDLRIATIRQFALDQLDNPDLSIHHLSNALGVSTRLIQRRFASLGTSFSDWLRLQRLEWAAALLANPSLSKVSITEIALECGFADASHFSRTFAKHFQCCPMAWRRERTRV